MPDLAFVFDGIGSSIISAIVGAILSAIVCIPASYSAGKRSISQKQKAGDSAEQIQIGIKNER